MIGHLGLERSFQNRFGQLLEQTVFPDDILGLLVVGEQLINQLLVDCHGVFHFLPPIAVYTVLFTPSERESFPLSDATPLRRLCRPSHWQRIPGSSCRFVSGT